LGDWDTYAKYLQSHDRQSIHKDSIRGWDYPGIGAIRKTAFQTSAFEMFKVSGSMRLIKDKELLRNIWRSYLDLEMVKDLIDTYYQLKMDESIKTNQLELAGVQIPIPLYDFFYSYAYFGAFELCQDMAKELKETKEKIEKYGKIDKNQNENTIKP